jgi:hypothetical protein
VGPTIREDFADVVDCLLYFVDLPGLLPFYHYGGPDDMGGSTTYMRRVSLGSGEARIRGLEMIALRSSRAFCVPCVQWKESGLFNNLKWGSPRSPM